ncbi:transmembrane protease, serine 2 [Nannochloropsis gaditana CCMP526]|uniref:transmembrane protease, serine 2 n=1 Tax=Nannochloropsis gaditana (strain CCMP526) TaxID=1093141 RepID=UPI00029F7E1E|nr:transmembrane protease, serine 2 [Nannochloropsis gaditana CCMP526]EKU22389.1 transmembrane protease, serine 2 [Nannochloropsis gaditana CCMP526]|eukprot:XP_005853973.1 transmembrane protease, serine 2 [Nannochloropsis gaditana CCMP526]
MRYTQASSVIMLMVAFGAFLGDNFASSAPTAEDLKAQAPQGPMLPLRPIAQTPFHGPSFIVGGGLADRSDSKWTVALVTDTHGRLFQFCGGTLISPKFVVTAAHCVAAGYDMSAVVGRYQLSDASSGEMIKVAEAFMHPEYDPQTMQGDIAILRLERAVSSDIPTLPLIPPTKAKMVNEGQLVTVLGWGLTEERSQKVDSVKGGLPVQGSGTDVLRAVTLPVVANAKCNEEYRAVTAKDSILDEEVCAGVDRGGLDSCQGDSGGPLTATVNGKTYLFGVVSWGVGCARAKVPGVYTRVSYHADWLASKMLLEVATGSGRGLGAVNVLFAGVNRAAAFSVYIRSLASNALGLTLGFAKGSSSNFNIDESKLSLPASGAVESATVSYKSTRAEVASAEVSLQINEGGKQVGEQTIALTAFALPVADFGKAFPGEWFSGADSGANAWVVDGGEIHSGNTHDAQTNVALLYLKGSGVLNFKWRSSSEETYDIVYFFLDNEPVDALTGDSGWLSKSLLIEGEEEEEHTVAFAYVKDKSMGKYQDKAFVKDLHFGAMADAGMERFAPILPKGKAGARPAGKVAKGRGLRGSGDDGVVSA